MGAVIISATALAGCFGAPPPPPANINPFATANVGQSIALEGEAVRFTGQASDQDGSIASYRWDWGDGTNSTGANLSNTTHTYADHGNYLANLNVTDNSGGTFDTISNPLRVQVLANFAAGADPHTPLAELSLYSPSAVIRPSEALTWGTNNSRPSWNNTAIDNGDVTWVINSFAINYGDGSSDSKDAAAIATWNGNFTHTFAAAGKYVVKLTVSTNASTSDVSLFTVVVLGTTTTPGVKNPDTYIALTIGDPVTLDPARAYDTSSGWPIENVYETLITYNGGTPSEFVPLLVTELPTIGNGGISNNNTTYIFHLKQGVKFHGGDTLDADDVVFSFQRAIRINDPDGPAWILGLTLNTSSVTKVDQYTVRFDLTQPYGPFLATLAYTIASIVSKQYVEAHGGVQDNTFSPWMDAHMDGTGPFKLKSWIPTISVILERNDGYHGAKPRLSAAIIRTVHEYSTRLLEFRNGNADEIEVPGPNRADFKLLATDPNEKITIAANSSSWIVQTGFFTYDINISQRANQTGAVASDNVPSNFFRDPKMREVFVKAFDYDSYLRDTVQGFGFRLHGVVPKGMYGYDTTIPQDTFDLTAASALYNQTQWVADHGYGAGFHLTIGYNAGNVNRQQAALMLQANLEKIDPSITIEVQSWTGSIYRGLVSGPTPGPVGLWFFGWAPDFADPDDYIQPFARTGGAWTKSTGYSNLTLDAMIDQAQRIPNGPDRLQLYHDIQVSLANENALLELYEATNYNAHHSYITGWYYNPMKAGTDFSTLTKA